MTFAHISFSTDAFADTAEALAENVNGIGGKALAEWLADALRGGGFEVTPIYAEDHGWDFDVTHAGARYHCAASIEADDAGRGGGVSIGKSRSLADRLLGRNKLGADDAVVSHVLQALERSSVTEEVVLEFA